MINNLFFCISFSWQYRHGHYFEISQFTGKKRDRTQSLWNRKEKRKNEKILFIYIILLKRAFPPKNKLSLMFFKKQSKSIHTRVIERILSKTLIQAPLLFNTICKTEFTVRYTRQTNAFVFWQSFFFTVFLQFICYYPKYIFQTYLKDSTT